MKFCIERALKKLKGEKLFLSRKEKSMIAGGPFFYNPEN